MNRDTGHDESIIANNVLIWGGGGGHRDLSTIN